MKERDFWLVGWMQSQQSGSLEAEVWGYSRNFVMLCKEGGLGALLQS